MEPMYLHVGLYWLLLRYHYATKIFFSCWPLLSKYKLVCQDDIPSSEPGRVSNAKTFTLHNIGNETDVPTCGARLITSKVPLWIKIFFSCWPLFSKYKLVCQDVVPYQDPEWAQTNIAETPHEAIYLSPSKIPYYADSFDAVRRLNKLLTLPQTSYFTLLESTQWNNRRTMAPGKTIGR